MANLESKLLDGKNAGYCSSSDDDEEDLFRPVDDEDQHQAQVMKGTSQAGVKGVLKEYAQFVEQQKRDKEEKERTMRELAHKGLLEGQKAEEDEEEEDDLEAMRKRRIEELKKAARGKMVEIHSKEEFLTAMDRTRNRLLCFVLYSPGQESSNRLSHVCRVLASEFPESRFARVDVAILEMSDRFNASGVPALQFYFNGELVGNFVQLTSFIGEDFNAESVIRFLNGRNISLAKNRKVEDWEKDDDDES